MLVTDDGGNVAILVNLSDICAVRYENFAVNSNGNTYKKKKKLADYLVYRGGESFLVYDKVNELIK